MMKTALTIAGSDCSGGAGIQADLKTFSAHGVFGMSAIVSVVAENTCRVISVTDMPAQCIIEQIDAIFEDIPPDAVKIGMLSGTAQMEAVAYGLGKHNPCNVVIDPVMVAKGGHALMNPQALSALKQQIIPLAFVLTPNIPEAETIAGIEIKTFDDMKDAAIKIHMLGAKNVLIKGGHSIGDANDILYDGKEFHTYSAKRINTKNTHGTGCTFSSAIASQLALGSSLIEAVQMAKEYITGAIENSLELGKGHGPTNHFYKFKFQQIY